MLEVEVFGARLLSPPLPLCEVERLCELALASAGVGDGHLAVEFVDAVRIGELNAEHRGKDGPTDVLSFPIDGVEPGGVKSSDFDSDRTQPQGVVSDGEGLHDAESSDDRLGAEETSAAGDRVPRELGDIVICPEHTVDLREAIVHGALHLVGMDHETDDGQMLAVQAEILRWEAP
jgi:probable rRNA maturation factor